VLLTVLIAAVLGSLTVLVLDPITMLFRSFASVVLPVLGSLITAIHTALYRVDFLQPAVEWADNAARSFLPLDQSFVLQSLPVLLLILGVFALNLVQPRFWCRYLCPLGALLGLVSRVSWLRYHVSQADCVACKKCVTVCPTGAIDPERQFAADLSDCNQCLKCREKCPVGAISFRWHRFQRPRVRWPRLRWPRGWRDETAFDPSRRRALGLFGAALACALLIRYVPWSRAAPRMAVRPPGSAEAELLSHCVRCGECIKVCPTGGLQPTLFNGGIAGLWTPELVPRVGYCDYQCNACGQVCPSRAIPQLLLEQKQQTVIGQAIIDEQRCLPWAEGTDCSVCWELCPVPHSAIRLVHRRRGGRGGVLCPEVIPDLCIGCGVCENKCPVDGEAAIRVYAPADVDSV
jgi:ferredoxin